MKAKEDPGSAPGTDKAQAGGLPCVRTLFLSDLHLGTAACQAERLLAFLRFYEVGTIYLVGDIIEGPQIMRTRNWPKAHGDVLRELLSKSRQGTRIVYIPGNHDEQMRRFLGRTAARIEVAESAIHEGVDLRRYLVCHGHEFDMVVQHARWLTQAGTYAYRAALAFSARLHKLLGRPRHHLSRSFSAQANRVVVRLVDVFSRSERRISAEIERHSAQGVIFGHTHHPSNTYVAGKHHLNLGDWVESCTGLVEYHDGRLEIMHWADARIAQTFLWRPRRHSGLDACSSKSRVADRLIAGGRSK